MGAGARSCGPVPDVVVGWEKETGGGKEAHDQNRALAGSESGFSVSQMFLTLAKRMSVAMS